MDDDKYVDAAIRPVLPSRATAAFPDLNDAAHQRPAFLDQPSPGTGQDPVRRTRGGTPKRRAKKSEALPPREIERILKARKKNMKKRKASTPASRAHAQVAAHNKREKRAARPKNPNRPLELASRLHTVLALVRDLPKDELLAFSTAMETVEKLSKPGRQRVLAALAKVYG